MRTLIIPLIAALLSGCHVVPKQLDDLGQDRGGLFQRFIEDNASTVVIKDTSANICASISGCPKLNLRLNNPIKRGYRPGFDGLHLTA
jgi:hypothetical protein